MSRPRDWSRASWENRYVETQHIDAPLQFVTGPWKPPAARKPLPYRRSPSSLQVGEAVFARRWGSGVILSFEPGGLVWVLFQKRFKRQVRYEELKLKP